MAGKPDMLTDLLIIRGRMGRARYMRLTLVAMLLLALGTIMLILPWTMSRMNGVTFVPLGLSTFAAVLQIALGLWIAVSSSIRRLHDMEWSALWLGLCLVPVEMIAIPAAIVLSLAMSIIRGTSGANAHGPDPCAMTPD